MDAELTEDYSLDSLVHPLDLLTYKINRKTGCWEWTGKIFAGYGYIPKHHREDEQFAHRIAFMLYVGEIPPDLYVCHSCDNRRCVNPSHLFLATQKENIHDSMEKGRWISKKKLSMWEYKRSRKSYQLDLGLPL